MFFKKASYIFYCLFFTATFFAYGQGGIKVISSGSYIINMGVEPQTVGNALKPYGLVYKLVSEYKVPVIWSIKNDKGLGVGDFTYDGDTYKGGPFIIEEKFLSQAVKDEINDWVANQGVTGFYTSSDFEAPFYDYITSVPDILVFSGKIGDVSTYLNDNAGIPIEHLSFDKPNTLATTNACSDVYIIGDVNAVQADQGGLYNFVTQRSGNVIALGKSVSTLEALNAPVSGNLNFLTDGKLYCYSAGECQNLLLTAVHAENHTNPIVYDEALGKDPIMQFIGQNLHLATENNDSNPSYETETWYLPLIGWRPETNIPVATSDANIPFGETGAKVVYGRAYGNDNYGRIMYLAGNDLNSGTAGDVAAQRLILNMILQTGIDNSETGSITANNNIIEDQPLNLSATFNGGFTPTNFEWRSTCGGTLNNTSGANATFTPDITNNRYTCEVSLVASDNCGHAAYATTTFTVYPQNNTPETQEDEVVAVGNQPLTIDVLANDSDPQPDDQLSLTSITQQPVNGTVNIVSNQLEYTGDNDTYVMDSLYYKVCDDGLNPLCDSTRVIIINELMINSAPAISNQSFTVTAGEISEICVTGSDAENDALEITAVSIAGVGTVNNDPSGDLCFTYQVAEDFTGTETVDITVCDIRENSLCSSAVITINVGPPFNPPPVVEDQTFNAVAGVLTNFCVQASDPEGDSITMQLVGNNNTFIDDDPTDLCFDYLSAVDFSGTDQVTIEICDYDPDNPQCSRAVISVVVGAPSIAISKAVTPDGDGNNDVFYVQNIESYPNATVRIFDRYGGVVFETSGYKNDTNNWNGYNGTKEAPAGTYFYYIELPKTGEKFKGYVELIK